MKGHKRKSGHRTREISFACVGRLTDMSWRPPHSLVWFSHLVTDEKQKKVCLFCISCREKLFIRMFRSKPLILFSTHKVGRNFSHKFCNILLFPRENGVDLRNVCGGLLVTSKESSVSPSANRCQGQPQTPQSLTLPTTNQVTVKAVSPSSTNACCNFAAAYFTVSCF